MKLLLPLAGQQRNAGPCLNAWVVKSIVVHHQECVLVPCLLRRRPRDGCSPQKQAARNSSNNYHDGDERQDVH